MIADRMDTVASRMNASAAKATRPEIAATANRSAQQTTGGVSTIRQSTVTAVEDRKQPVNTETTRGRQRGLFLAFATRNPKNPSQQWLDRTRSDYGLLTDVFQKRGYEIDEGTCFVLARLRLC